MIFGMALASASTGTWAACISCGRSLGRPCICKGIVKAVAQCLERAVTNLAAIGREFNEGSFAIAAFKTSMS